MTTAALRGVVSSIRRYGRLGVLRPGAMAAGIVGTWRVGRPAVSLSGQAFLQAEDVGVAALAATLLGQDFRVGDSRTWHRVTGARREAGGLYVVDVDPEGWPGEFAEGAPVTWARNFGGSVGYGAPVARRARQAVFYSSAGRFFGEALFIVGQASLVQVGYPVAGGFPEGTGLSIEGQHFEVVGSRPVWGSDGIYYWELLGVLPAVGVTAVLKVDAGRHGAGEAAVFTVDVAGDAVGEWRWGLERLYSGGWSLAGGAALGAEREFSVTEGVSDRLYRGVGELRDGGYYVTNEVEHQWV